MMVYDDLYDLYLDILCTSEKDIKDCESIAKLLNHALFDVEGYYSIESETDGPVIPEDGGGVIFSVQEGNLDYYFSKKGDKCETKTPKEALDYILSTLPTLSFTYKNYKGKVSQRKVYLPEISYKYSEYHCAEGESVWIITAFDPEKGDLRDFCMKDMIQGDS